MPKRRSQQESLPSPRRLSRREREERIGRILMFGTYGVLAVVLILFGIGLAERYIVVPRTPVATVADTTIRLDTYQDLYRFRHWTLSRTIRALEAQKQQFAASEALASLVDQFDQQIAQATYELSSLPTDVLDELIDGEISRREAGARGLTVTDDELQAEIERRFGYDRNPAPEPTAAPEAGDAAPEPGDAAPEGTDPPEAEPTEAAEEAPTPTPFPTEEPMTEDEFQSLFGSYIVALRGDTGVTEATFREFVRAEMLLTKVVEAIADDVPTTAEQVSARHIVLASEEEARAALERLRAGEGWDAVAAEVSTDTLTKDEGGDLGWLPRGIRSTAFDEAAFALQPGEMSDVVEVDAAYEIVLVTERAADRELDPSHLQILQNRAVFDWFAERRQAPDVVRHWTSSMVPSPTR